MPEIEKYKNAKVTWAQEEPKNQGFFYFVEPRLRNIMKHLKRDSDISYAGRVSSASTATGFGKIHEQELKNLLQEAMKI